MNRIFIRLVAVFFMFSILSCKTKKQLASSSIQIAESSASKALQQDATIAEFVGDSILNNAQIGICVYNPKTNLFLYNYQSNKYFVPASNVKIATCYAAMNFLEDSLVGLMYQEDDSALFIQATGDPSFLHKNFTKQPIFDWLKQTKKNIYFVANSNNKFKAKPLGKGWAWDDYLEPYMAERSVFPMYANTVKFYHNKTSYKTIPSYFEKFFDNQFEPSDGNLKFDVVRNYGENSFFYNIKPGKKDTVTITFNTNSEINPPHLLLADTLKKDVKSVAIQTAIQKKYSQPTDLLLKQMMHNSDNFFAEQALLMVSFNQLGYMSDEKMIDTLLKTEFKDLPQKPKWVDGSGLSRYNLFTPQDFVCILGKMQTKFGMQRIENIFPTGDEGTLKGYYKEYRNKIFAKTGSLSNIFSLSGFLKTNHNNDLIFSIIINGHQTNSTNIRVSVEKFIRKVIESN